MQGNVWYNVEVPKSLEKKNENFSLKMPVSLLKTLAEIAEAEDRPLGYVGRELMIRGLALYQKDGRLRDGVGIKSAEVAMTIEPGINVAERNRLRRELNKPIDIPRKRKTG